MNRVQIARAVVELTSPMGIGTGSHDDVLDAPVVLDADGLPALPGSSVAGVLKDRALRAGHAPRQVERWFGCAGAETRSSSLWVSWGRPHGERDQPIAPKLHGGNHDDPVLTLLKGTVMRDHVRLDDRGVADGAGKFDRSLVPAGARFTLELRLDDPDGLEIEEALAWLADASFGGATRSGFGAVRVVRARVGRMDLRDPEQAETFRQMNRALWDRHALPGTWSPEQISPAHTFEVHLVPEHALLIGGGSAEADLTYFTEERVAWEDGRGRVVTHPVLPGTALRGALRHRARFHLEVLAKSHSDVDADRAHTLLFGSDPGRDRKATLQPGLVRIPETVLPAGEAHRQRHVALDRFTLGPRDGMLFDEEALWLDGEELTVLVGVDDAADRQREHGLRALRRALEDLCEGRLGLGHGGSRGHGFFHGTLREAAP